MAKKPLTELRDADIHRVDAVKGAANGTRFLIAKAAADGAGIVSAEEVRDLITEPAVPDIYVDGAGSLIKAELSSAERKNLPDNEFAYVDEQGVGHYPINDAAHVRNALSRAAAAISAGGDAADTARKALPKINAAAKRLGIGDDVAKGKETAVATVTNAEQNDARQVATAKAADSEAKDGDENAASEAAETDEAGKTKPDEPDTVEKKRLKKAAKAAKAARLEKRAVKDRLIIAKAQRILAKAGKRNSGGDQLHIDAADGHLGALGATYHQAAPDGRTSAASAPNVDLAKSTDAQAAGFLDMIQKAIGPMLPDREAIQTELAQMSEQLAKIAKTAMPGGPRVVLDRDGALIAAPDGELGLTPDQAALRKVAERFPVGSVQREELTKAGATLAIRDLMEARAR